jgi:CRISPR-associated protein Csb1
MNNIAQFDHYFSDNGPAALVVREYLTPVEGKDGVLFPATYAPGDGFPGGYNIDGDPTGENIALIDSVGSQANRIEPIFAEPDYAKLVPQVIITAGSKPISLLQAGHRAGDAIVRASGLQHELQNAFRALLDGNATALAKLAPTSLVFGVWDSRDTQAKVPRAISSTIRAYNVRKLTRSAQFVPAIDYVEAKLLDEPADKAAKDSYAERGFVHVPATGTHGGIIAKGDIRRDATLSLVALRLLHAGSDPTATLKLRRYILGLALVAFTRVPSGYLRQGTILVLDPDKPSVFVEVLPTGKRTPATVTHEQALAYATVVAKEFGVGADRTEAFDPERAREDLKPKKEKAARRAKGAAKTTAATPTEDAHDA